MDLTYPAEIDQYRSSVKQFLSDHLPSGWQGIGALGPAEREQFLRGWRDTLLEHRLLAPGWPAEYGGAGLSVLEQSVVAEEFVRAGVPQMPHPNDAYGFGLLGQTLMHWGTPEQKDHFLSRTVNGDIHWAQGYSEPNAGSDLFNLRTRAQLDGDEWVVNGQKIWQSAGVTANWIFALVRTDPDAVRSKGISFMLIPLEQPGVEVRGIRNMAGEVEFAEVFFDNARTAAGNVVGGVNNGAKVALTLLGFERGAGGVAASVSMFIELERLIELARAKGKDQDPSVRQAIATCWTKVHVLRCLGMRAVTAGATGRPPGPESSIIKLFSSEYHKAVTELAVAVLGTGALAPDGPAAVNALGAQPRGLDPASSAAWVADFLHARPGTVYGGSSEIQRNTIGEQVLSLPREPRLTIAPAS
jgi:alkylation response protein AidB-like acyl-CoA dehydrogenase